MHYRREIDGLRAIAVIPVVLYHAGFTSWFGGGFVGVDVFFVISGYLVTGIILSEKEAGNFSIARFYERRARRILPALVVVVLATLPFTWMWLLPAHLEQFWRSLLALSVFSSNILFWRESGYFDSAAELKPLLHTWSLAVEEQYYLLFPLLVIVLWRLGQRRLMGSLLIVAVPSLVLAEWAAFRKPTAAYFLLPTRGWELLLGSLISLYFHRRNREIPHMACELGSLSGFAVLAAAIVTFDKSTPFPGLSALLPTVGTALIIIFSTPQTLVGRLLGGRWLVGIGLISYSAYLWHQPIFALARHRSTDELSVVWMILLCVTSLALAAVTWRYVEQPFRQVRNFSRSQVFALAAAASGAFFVIGSLGVIGYLMPRYNEAEMEIAGYKDRWEKYTWARMDALHLKDFRQGAHKVLIIGDSQAADFVNIVHESQFLTNVSFSTYTIPWSCGNLYLPYSVAHEIEPSERAKCQEHSGYRDELLDMRLREAHEVWLVSFWRLWHMKHLIVSLDNLQTKYGDKFIVVGQKSFKYRLNRPMLAQWAGMSLEHKRRITIGADDSIGRINEHLKARLGPVFLDLSEHFCYDGQHCRLFDDEGNVIPYDGTHVTPAGARFAGRRLAQHPRLQHIFKRPPTASSSS